MNMISISKHVALSLAKVAPFLGLTMIIAAFQTEGNGSMWLGIWRIVLSVAMGVFVARVGAIYQNLHRRLESREITAKNDFVPRREYDARHAELIRQLDRIEISVSSSKRK